MTLQIDFTKLFCFITAMRLVGFGFNPSPGHKKINNETHSLLGWHSIFKVGPGGLDHPMIPLCGTAATHCSVRE